MFFILSKHPFMNVYVYKLPVILIKLTFIKDQFYVETKVLIEYRLEKSLCSTHNTFFLSKVAYKETRTLLTLIQCYTIKFDHPSNQSCHNINTQYLINKERCRYNIKSCCNIDDDIYCLFV